MKNDVGIFIQIHENQLVRMWGRKESLNTAGGNVNLCNLHENQYGVFYRK